MPLWALAGIAKKFASDSVVTIPTWTVFGLIVLALGWVFLGKNQVRS
ncbi:MAG: hypothetical protein GX577_04260 [Leptolinea sp.]|nr:hypothetical protein [Leptolinea sp.]